LGHFFNGDDAAFKLIAAGVLELDGGVADLEVVIENVVELDQDAGALRRGNVGDGDVAGQGAGVGAEAPDVQVVDVDDALDGSMPGANGGSETPRGRAFEQDIEGLADDAEAGPEDERGDEQRENRVDPVLAGEQDARAAGDDGGGGERVAGHVEKGRAQVDVAGHAPEQGGDDAVHQHAGGGYDHHEPGCTATGAERRWTASMTIQSEMTMSVAALMKAASTPARW
jgi:hypothetical protein